MSKGLMLLLLMLLVLVGLAAQKSEPEIRRYLKMRSM
jgi:outer membrane lipoprotein-sorting protein